MSLRSWSPYFTADSELTISKCLRELREAAHQYLERGFVPAINADCLVVKSDDLISEARRLDLSRAVRRLEDMPEVFEDSHPGSDAQVLDLVHP